MSGRMHLSLSADVQDLQLILFAHVSHRANEQWWHLVPSPTGLQLWSADSRGKRMQPIPKEN